MKEEIDQILTDFEDDNIGQPIAKEKLSQLFYTKMEDEKQRTKDEMMKYACDFNWDYEKNKPKHKSYIALEDVLKILKLSELVK